MKKSRLSLLVLATVIATILVAGCSSPTQTSPQVASSSSNIAVTINSQQTANQIGSGFFAGTPQAGNKFLIFDVTVTNHNENNWPIGSPLYFKLTTADNSVYQYSSSTHYLGANALTLVSGTNPGEKVTGQIAFEIPQSATAKTLTYNDGFGNEVVLSTASVPTSTLTGSSSSNPSPSASATPTAVPPGSGKIATSISGGPTFLSQTQSPIAQGTKVSWAFEVIAQGHILCGNGATVTVLIDGKSVGQVHPQSPVDGSCFATANFDWTATSGSHTLTVTYAGNDMYQSSELPPVHLVVTS